MSLTISVPGPQEFFQKIGQTIKDSGKQRRILGEEQIDRGQIFFARDEFLDHHRGLLKHHRASGQLGKKSTSWKKKILAGPAKLEKKKILARPAWCGGGGVQMADGPKNGIQTRGAKIFRLAKILFRGFIPDIPVTLS